MEFIKKKRNIESTKKDKRLKLNVGGVYFETLTSTLENIGGSRLALLAQLQEGDDSWDPEKQEYFFDRHPGVFMSVIHYYRTDELHIDQNLCGNIIQGELEYWGLTELDIEPCCWGHYCKFKDHRETLAALDDNFTSPLEIEAWGDKPTNLQKFKHRMWQFFEEPSTSRGAKVFAVMSMFFVVLSIGIFCLETYHWFRVPIPGAVRQNSTYFKGAYVTPAGDYCIETDTRGNRYSIDDTEPHPAMEYLDYICAAYFTTEFVLRVVFAPSKLAFIKSALNVIDLLCLVPHLISIILVTTDPNGAIKDTSQLFKSMLALRTVRILRIFKLMKHYSAFKILVYTIKVSTKELLLLVVFLFTGVLIFASIIFYAENETFDNIPIGFWWALVTMTTVGYGDKVPKTEGGYIIGCFCVLCGVLTVAFTVPIVVNNFTLYYSHAQSRIKLPVHKRKELKRKIFLKSKKSLEFLQKLKWKRERRQKEFSDLNAIKTPRSAPSEKMDKDEVNANGKATSEHWDSIFETDENALTNNPKPESSSGSLSERSSGSKTPQRIPTVSETITETITLPGTPSDLSISGDDLHKFETEQLLQDFAKSDKKRREERKRQLSMINQKREVKRLQLAETGRTGKTPRQTPAPAASKKTH